MVYERLIDDIAIGQRVVAIDTSEDRSKAIFASSRTAAWHELGTTVPADMSVEEAIKLSGVDPNVTKETLVAKIVHPAVLDETGVTDEWVEEVEVPQVALVGTDPFTGRRRHLNNVGKDYPVIQASELGEMGHAVLAESGGAQITSIGEFNSGRTVFMSLRLPLGVKVGGVDRQDFYLGLVNHHGDGPLTAVITPVRFECRNTTRAGLAQSVAKISLRHTSGIRDRMLEARKALDLTVEYVEEFEAMMNGLLAKEATPEMTKAMVSVIWKQPPPTATDRTKNTWTRRFDAIVSEIEAPQNEFGRGTAYGLWNGLTSYANFVEPVRVAKISDAEKQVIRASKVVDGDSDWITDKGLRFLVNA